MCLVKQVRLSLGLNGSNFEAKGGIVGGSVNVGRINTLCQLDEDKDVEPFHKLALQVRGRLLHTTVETAFKVTGYKVKSLIK